MYQYRTVATQGDFLIADVLQGIEKLINYICKNNVKNLSLNELTGYSLSDINALTDIGSIEKLEITCSQINLSGIEKFVNLKYLYLSEKVSKPVDFSAFKKLETLNIEWNKNVASLKNASKLKQLTLRKYKGDFQELKNLNLNSLTLIDFANSTLDFLENHAALKNLSLHYGRKLTDLSVLATPALKLEHLEIQNCKKIQSYEFLSEMKYLRKLQLAQTPDLPNVKFVLNLDNLKFFSFVGLKVLDGDISPCINLEYVGFMNNRNYNYKSENGRLFKVN